MSAIDLVFHLPHIRDNILSFHGRCSCDKEVLDVFGVEPTTPSCHICVSSDDLPRKDLTKLHFDYFIKKTFEENSYYDDETFLLSFVYFPRECLTQKGCREVIMSKRTKISLRFIPSELITLEMGLKSVEKLGNSEIKYIPKNLRDKSMKFYPYVPYKEFDIKFDKNDNFANFCTLLELDDRSSIGCIECELSRYNRCKCLNCEGCGRKRCWRCFPSHYDDVEEWWY